jgi:recombination protein RecT
MVSAKGLITKQKEQAVQSAPKAGVALLDAMFKQDSVQARFQRMLGKKSAGFISSVLTVVSQNKLLQNVDMRTVLSAASIAASLDLPILPSLGRAWIVPYKGVAQFQIGYLGYVELAQRSGLYKSINVNTVYEGEVVKWNKFTEELTYGEQESDTAIGYCASFELLNGFRKVVYWTKDAVIKHAKRFSKSYNSSSSPWQSDFDAMAMKTVLAYTLRHWGPMSIEMQKAMAEDVDAHEKPLDLSKDNSVETIETEDASETRVVDTESGEILQDNEFTAEDIEAAVEGE